MEPGQVLALSTLATGISLGTVVALVVGVAAGVSLVGNDRLSGGAKAMWFAAIILFPILGSAVYFGVRSDWWLRSRARRPGRNRLRPTRPAALIPIAYLRRGPSDSGRPYMVSA